MSVKEKDIKYNFGVDKEGDNNNSGLGKQRTKKRDSEIIANREEILEKKKNETEEFFNEDDSRFESVEPVGARVLVKFISKKEDGEEDYLKTKSGLFLPVQEMKINSQLNIGKIVNVGNWFNYYTGTWMNLKEQLNIGDVIAFEMVKFTPVDENYALVPIDSIYAKIGKIDDAVEMNIKSNVTQR